LRRRFERAAGESAEAPAPIAAESAAPAEPARPVNPPEFTVPIVEAEVIAAAPQRPPEFEVPAAPEETSEEVEIVDVASDAPSDEPSAGEAEEAGVQEIDLSEEWAALAQHGGATIESESAPPAAPVENGSAPVSAQEDEAAAPERFGAALHAAVTKKKEPAKVDTDYAFELEAASDSAPASDDERVSERLLAELANGFDDVAALLVGDAATESPAAAEPATTRDTPAAMPPATAAAPPIVPVATTHVPPAAAPSAPPKSAATAPRSVGDENADPLHQVFEEFRAELGEIDTHEEDIETHYNLGVAYREMGLLEEAISEFQKVAKVSDRDHAFRYALQCCTLLGLSFMEKGQPSIAAMWYERGLRIPDLDQETRLALRYDLGVAQDLSGDSAAALKSFAEVYGTNIDYRDVAERLAALEKAR